MDPSAPDPAPLGGHSASLYSPLTGSLLGGTQGEDLWTILTSRPCWVVDNNIDWFSAATAEPQHHFVLGRTMLLESDWVQTVWRRSQRQPLPNVFTFGIIDLPSGNPLLVDRVDNTIRAVLDGRPPTVESRTPAQIAQANDPRIREQKRSRVRLFENRVAAELEAEILALKPRAVRRYPMAGEISLGAYAIHLGELRRRPDVDRVGKFESNAVNLFSDAEVIQDALCIPAAILSNDRVDVGRMAQLLAIPVRQC